MVCGQITCKFCKSTKVVRNGKRRGIQYYICRNCGKGFVDNEALPGMKYPIEVISSVMYQHHSGLSINKIGEQIKRQYNLYPANSTIHNWINRFSHMDMDNLMEHHN